MKVNPMEVEKCLLSHPSIKEVMVKGVPHSDFGEVIESTSCKKKYVFK
jgi:Acyl-CoA synthetases (AMP-forming)/AMP-acid ligases II